MRYIEFDREFDYRVHDYLEKNYSKSYSKRWTVGDTIVAVFVHEEFVFRTSSNQTITVIYESAISQQKSRITVIASGGGQGLLGMDWGSQSAAEDTLERRIREMTTGRNASRY
ncbi:MAG: hypothetical protein C4K48_04090 [Candidatus Thorarchaeota archaeon]|nr:MAG: hypothetical protein C4K48_04090 [Candidatus Thorarchaeota archaeon]